MGQVDNKPLQYPKGIFQQGVRKELGFLNVSGKVVKQGVLPTPCGLKTMKKAPPRCIVDT